MVIIILGAITFLLIGDHQDPMGRLTIGWACACATAIFVAGRSGIDSLMKEVEALRKRARQVPRTKDTVIDFLEMRSLKE